MSDEEYVDTRTVSIPKFYSPSRFPFSSLWAYVAPVLCLPLNKLSPTDSLTLIPLSVYLPTSQLQKSECMLSRISEALDQTKSSLKKERQETRQIQDQLHHSNTEVERLQKELTLVHHTTEKKVIGFVFKVFIQILHYKSL